MRTHTGDGTAAVPRPPGTALLTAVAVAAGAAAAGVLFRTGSWYVALPTVAAAVAAGAWLGSLALKQHWLLLLLVIVIGGPLPGAAGSAAWADTVMDGDGERVTAVVAEADYSGRSAEYTLRRGGASGPAVRGGPLAPVRHLETGDRAVFEEGDRVRVLEHPDGTYPPVLPSDTRPALWTGVWALLTAGLWGVLRSVLMSRPRQRG